MAWAQDRQEGRRLTVLDEESHAAAARRCQADVRSQKAPQLLGLQQASIAAQVVGELTLMRGFLIDRVKLTWNTEKY